jgi:hypothetical protein
MTFKLARVKTVGTFTAEDPRNQNRRTSFNIDLYVLTPGGGLPNAKRLAGYNRFYSIRSEVDGVECLLPESLTHLWEETRIPADALPRLLKEMGPMLKQQDFRLRLLTRKATVLMFGLTGLYALMVGWGVFFVAGSTDKLIAGTLIALPGVFFGAFLYLMLFRQRARRKRQMVWALAHV